MNCPESDYDQFVVTLILTMPSYSAKTQPRTERICPSGVVKRRRRVVTARVQYFHSLPVIYGTVSRSGRGATCSSSAGAPGTGLGMRPPGQRHAIEIRTPQPCRSRHFPGNTDTRALDSSDSPTWLFFSECPGRRRRVGFHCWRRVDRAEDYLLKADTVSLGF